MKTHIPYLDGWRGLAIVFLLIGHFFPVPGLNLGTVGVSLFFVLSGFLMSRILFVDKVPLSIFYRRRLSRILPSVVVLLLVVVLAYLAAGRPISRHELLSAASFTNNYFVTAGWTMPLGHIWSLSVEEHAYVLLSLLALLARARHRSGLLELGAAAGAAAGCALLYWYIFGRNPPLGLWLHTEVAAYGIVASGFLLLALRARPSALPGLAAPLLLGLGICAYWWRFPPPFMLLAGGGAFALALNLLDRSPPWFRTLLAFPPLRKLGTWSFSLYLWQQPFYMLHYEHGLPAPLALACALAVGIVAFHLVENPARLWLNRVLTAKIALPRDKDDVPMPQA